MKKSVMTIILITSIIVSFWGCSDDAITPQAPRESLISFNLTVFPDIGSTDTPFEIAPKNFSNTTGLAIYKFRYDFDGDGTFDTDWVDTTTYIHKYETTGKKTIKVEFKDHLGEVKFYVKNVFVGELELVPGLNSEKNHNEPNFAKDGTTRILYSLYNNSHQIYISDYLTGAVTQLTTGDADENNCKHNPDWSPDGSTIAVTYQDKTYLIDSQTGELTKLSDLYPFGLEYSPDGKKLVINGGIGEKGTYLIDLETKEEKLLFNRQNGVCWSPDGKQLAEYIFETQEVNIVNATDGAIVKTFKNENVKVEEGRSFYLDWSADGKWIHLCRMNALLNIETGIFYNVYPGKFKRKSWAESTMNSDVSMIAFTNSTETDKVDQVYILKLPSELKE